MSLKQALQICDGDSTDEMLRVYAHFQSAKEFEKQLIDCLADRNLERPASWLLKHHLEMGFMLSNKLNDKALQAFQLMEHWEARLHILQMLKLFQINDSMAPELWQVVLQQTQENNKLIRAWSYNALHEISLQHPEYKSQALSYLNFAEKNEQAASVLARVRKIKLNGGY